MFFFHERLDTYLHRLKATSRMSGTLRVGRVPYLMGEDEYVNAVALLDSYSGKYPVRGNVSVSKVGDNQPRFTTFASHST